jgi:hypothetical protein
MIRIFVGLLHFRTSVYNRNIYFDYDTLLRAILTILSEVKY